MILAPCHQEFVIPTEALFAESRDLGALCDASGFSEALNRTLSAHLSSSSKKFVIPSEALFAESRACPELAEGDLGALCECLGFLRGTQSHA